MKQKSNWISTIEHVNIGKEFPYFIVSNIVLHGTNQQNQLNSINNNSNNKSNTRKRLEQENQSKVKKRKGNVEIEWNERKKNN